MAESGRHGLPLNQLKLLITYQLEVVAFYLVLKSSKEILKKRIESNILFVDLYGIHRREKSTNTRTFI